MTESDLRRSNFTHGYYLARRDDAEIKKLCVRFEGRLWADCNSYYARQSKDGWWLHSWFSGMSIYPAEGEARTWRV